MIRTFTGPNSFMLNDSLKRAVKTFVDEYSDLGLERLDGEEVEYDRIRESLESLPFLASRKLIVLRSGSANKLFIEHAERLFKELPESTDLFLVEPKLDKRSGYYKLLKKVTDYSEFTELDGGGLARWLVSRAKEQGGSISMADATLLINRVGANQQLLANELMKLITHTPQVSKDTILLLTEQTPQSSTFDLLDAALNGRTKQAVSLYDEQRKQKVEPVQIIALLAWQLHVLALIKTAGGKDAQTIAREAKLNPFVVKKSMAIARRLTLAELKLLIRSVRDADVRLKSESVDPDELMLHLLMQIRR